MGEPGKPCGLGGPSESRPTSKSESPDAVHRLRGGKSQLPANQDRDDIECRLSIVRRAAERMDNLLALVLGAIFDELPDYGAARSKGDLEDIRSGIRRTVELCLRVLADGRRIDSDERVGLHLTGGQRARQGIPKPVVLRSVTIATRGGYNFFVSCADEDDPFGHLTRALQQIRTLLAHFEDDAVRALGDGYDEAFDQLLSSSNRGEAILVDRLLEDRWHDENELADHARAAGLQPGREARVLVVTPLDSFEEGRLHSTVSGLRDRAPMALGPVRFASRIHLPVVVQPRHDDAWRRLLVDLDAAAGAEGTTVVYGERAARLTATSLSYKAIERGLPFVPAATGQAGAVPALLVRFHRVTNVGKPADRMELLNDVLGPLRSLPTKEQVELLSTLDALYEVGGSWASLAKRLGLHKNTFSNRMRRVRDVTGLDVRRPAERLVLETMLRLRFVAEDDLAADGVGVDWRANRPA